ncbi:MAG: Rieske (2Fe-2S) protein [Thiobacillaceae bacterium]
MAACKRLICASTDLEEGGRGVRFELTYAGEVQPAFVIRFAGVVRAYLNRCGHIPVELDYLPGDFFDLSRLYLVCATHGALYDPATGACLGGRCNGRGLTPLPVVEEADGIYLMEER